MTAQAVLSLGRADRADAEQAEQAEQRKRRQLAVTKRQATALLGAVSVVWLVVTIWGGRHGWAPYVQATAEASMVGGLADWFAVTALFRHPLGLPIPHTAVVVERKDSFGATLGSFIRESFLAPDTIAERVRAAGVVARLSSWLADPDHAARTAETLAGGAASLAEVADDAAVRAALSDVLGARLADVDLAPLAGRALRTVLAAPGAPDVLAPALRGASRYLDQHREDLQAQLTRESPWWLPGPVEDRIAAHLLDGAGRALREMAADPGHPLRRHLAEALDRLAGDLETSPAMRARGEELKHALLSRPEVAEWTGHLWDDLKAQLRAAADDAGSPLRARLAGAVAAAGRRLRDDPALAGRVEAHVESAARSAAGRFGGEMVDLVSQTIGRWDADETARRLELLLGADLQYIRINGTVVGAGAGLAIFSLGRLLVR